jgi:protein kinase A
MIDQPTTSEVSESSLSNTNHHQQNHASSSSIKKKRMSHGLRHGPRSSEYKAKARASLFAALDNEDDDDVDPSLTTTKTKQPKDKKLHKHEEEVPHHKKKPSSKSKYSLKKKTGQNSKKGDLLFRKNVQAAKLTIDWETFVAPVYEKEDQQQALIIEKTAAESCFVLKDFWTKGSATDIDTLVKAFEPLQAKSGEVIVEQGESGNHLYLIESGKVEFQIDGITVGTAEAGGTFGEMNLLFSAPEKASIVGASSDDNICGEVTKLLRVDQETFRGIMMQTSEMSRRMTQQQQAQDMLSSGVPSSPSSSMVMIMDSQNSDWLTNSKLMHEREMIRNSLQTHIKLEDLERISVLGEGQFGEVWLVAADLPGTSLIEKKQKFALKVQYMQPGGFRDEDAVEAIRNEIQAMQDLSHPFLANLFHTYESDASIDMLLGLVSGGELWDLIHHQCDDGEGDGNINGEWTSGGIPASHAQFYSMILTDTLAYIHGRSYIFRDLKPENIMIDQDGYPIIVDFGFAKYCPDQCYTYTFCGTPSYVAPEIIKNSGHNAGVDYWALGVVIYEMITGENPFYYDGMEQMTLYQAIVDEPYEPLKEETHSPSVRDLIDKLLEKDPSLRLGVLSPNDDKRMVDILEHEWFHGLDLNQLRNKQVKAPWTPNKEEQEVPTTTSEEIDSSPVVVVVVIEDTKTSSPVEEQVTGSEGVLGEIVLSPVEEDGVGMDAAVHTEEIFPPLVEEADANEILVEDDELDVNVETNSPDEDTTTELSSSPILVAVGMKEPQLQNLRGTNTPTTTGAQRRKSQLKSKTRHVYAAAAKSSLFAALDETTPETTIPT